MQPDLLRNSVLKALLYYDIFSHPLSADELFTFVPENSVSPKEFCAMLEKVSAEEGGPIGSGAGYYYIKPNIQNIKLRKEKENISRKMWRMAGIVTHVIKRFPYVRCVLISGSLSKNSSNEASDIDFMIITGQNRLWISRTLLMLFKKIFLLNSYKYFCLNYYITSSHLEIEEKNIFTATEIATVKATYNTEMMRKFVNANMWIKEYFPNYVKFDPALHSPGCKASERVSYLQKFIEFFFNGRFGDRLNKKFLKMTIKHWYKRYAHIDRKERNLMFKSTENISKAHPHNMQKQILDRYSDKLKEFRLI